MPSRTLLVLAGISSLLYLSCIEETKIVYTTVSEILRYLYFSNRSSILL